MVNGSPGVRTRNRPGAASNRALKSSVCGSGYVCGIYVLVTFHQRPSMYMLEGGRQVESIISASASEYG